MELKKELLLLLWFGTVALSYAQGQQAVSIIPSEKNVKKFINESYFVSCTTQDGSLRADWINPKGQKIDGNMHSRIRVEQSYGVDLFLTRITSQDTGTYTCVTQRGRASFTLTVLRPITFDTSFAEQSASEGKAYTMRCVASGQSTPRIYWKVDNKNPQMPKYKVTKEGSLIIQNVTLLDGKRLYACRAMDMESPVPDARAMNITLKVKTRPKMLPNAKEEHWGVLGEWANLTCAVHAEPPARFQWFHRNRTIQPSDENSILNPQDNVSVLQVLVRNEGRFGQYTCRASNDQGHLDKKMLLNKGQKPATPVLEIDVVAHDGARIRVKDFRSPSTRDPAAEESKKAKILPVIGYHVQVKMMTRSDWKMANATKYDEGFVIRGLSPGITYQVRAAAKNLASIGEYSHAITVITSKTTTWSISSAINTKAIAAFTNLITLSVLALTI